MSTEFRIHALDMGNRMYGDCLLVEAAGRVILIDGGHESDFDGQEGFDSIPEQIKSILGTETPEIDLLIITHVHADHIGALPKMFAAGMLSKVRTVLAADEDFGFGHLGHDDALGDQDLTPTERSLLAAATEEDYSGLPDSELLQFLQDAPKLEPSYTNMLQALNKKSKVIRYLGQKLTALEQEFADVGLKILGPTKEHLQHAAEATARANQENARRRKKPSHDDVASDVLTLYREMFANRVTPDDAAQLDAGFARDGKNNTSIVIKLEVNGKSALLGGDMQFADPLIAEMNEDMLAIRKVVKDNGPYDLVKTSHHTSFNGLDDDVMNDYHGTKLFLHSGGFEDPDHPDADALKVLKKSRAQIEYARTDRNGQITATLSPGKPKFKLSKGSLNNFAKNPKPRRDDSPSSGRIATVVGGSPTPPRSGGAGAGGEDEFVEVLVKIPHRRTHVTITVSVDPDCGGEGAGPTPAVSLSTHRQTDRRPKSALPSPEITPNPKGAFKLAGGRDLPKLLFVTQPDRLIENMDYAARALLKELAAKVDLLELPADTIADPNEAARSVAAQIRPAYHKGIVLLGGYDVVPPRRLNTITDELRERVIQACKNDPNLTPDPDSYMVWNDDGYVDRDGDGLPELAVTRIPDGRHPEMLRTALQAVETPPQSKFGIRNSARPFAEVVFPGTPGAGLLKQCVPFLNSELQPAQLRVNSIYLMLHGSAVDGKRFDGEGAADSKGISIERVKEVPGAVVFAGCCYGALCGESLAQDPKSVRGRALKDSIAMQFLDAGARAFIGCTGIHYSPGKAPDRAGGPMHVSFWKHYASGASPAEALFRAKIDYSNANFHGERAAPAIAIERKILGEFTCLGLGW